MTRQVFLLDLHDETSAAEYEACHRPGNVPAAVLDEIRSTGVEAMEIYRLGDRLVMITESRAGADASSRVASQASRDWEACMDRFQCPLPGGRNGEKWRAAECIFNLYEHDQKETAG